MAARGGGSAVEHEFPVRTRGDPSPRSGPAGRTPGMTPTTTVLATVVSDDFEPGFIVMLGSLLEHNPWFDHEIRVLWDPEVAPLSPQTRDRLIESDSRVRLCEVDLTQQQRLTDYRDTVLNTPKRFHASFLILEALRFTDVDRVVAMDADLLVLGDLKELFTAEDHFAAVEACHLTTGPRGFFNGGVMVFNRPHLTGETYRRLVEEIEMEEADVANGPAEQAVLNKLFASGDHRWLPTRYNVQKRLVPDRIGDVDAELSRLDARILHFIGDKPWHVPWGKSEQGYTHVERMWEAAFLRYGDEDDLARALATRRARLFSRNP